MTFGIAFGHNMAFGLAFGRNTPLGYSKLIVAYIQSDSNVFHDECDDVLLNKSHAVNFEGFYKMQMLSRKLP
jgi:hypothetical protein